MTRWTPSPGTWSARDDVHATARYRRELVRRIGREVALRAVQDRDARNQMKEAA